MTYTMTLLVHRDWLLTSNQRLHWAVRARNTRYLRNLAKLRAHGCPTMTVAHCTVTLTWRRRDRRRDAGNWYGTAKALIDGCVVDAGLLPDDDSRHLVGPDMREADPDPNLRPGYVRVELIFEEII